MQWDDKQKQAINIIETAKFHKIYITGQAGTGKSELMKYCQKILSKQGWLVSLTAPTGKASKRIGGTTIHSWLEPVVEQDKWFNVKITGWKKTSFSNKECLIIDEASMLDDTINKRINEIFDNTNPDFQTKIVYVGDTKQLPPVEGGEPFINFINKYPKQGIVLEHIYRQKGNNDIVTYASFIRHNQKITNNKQWNNVHFVHFHKAIQAVVQDHNHNQILCPKKKDKYGAVNINKEIQKQLNYQKKIYDKKIWVQKDNKQWYQKIDYPIFKNNKIVITKNNWFWNITNGTTCVVLKKGIKKCRIWVLGSMLHTWTDVVYLLDLDTDKVFYVPLDWLAINSELGYALTVHKFQGSQCPNIYLMLTQDQMHFCDTTMLYTAVTRAEQHLYIIQKIML